MTITAITGCIGSGKSLLQLEIGLRQAHKKRRTIVANFPLNFSALKRYCAKEGLFWIPHLIDSDRIAIFDASADLKSLCAVPEAIVLLDEAGIHLNARAFSSTPKELLADLAQSRKDGIDLIYCSQFDEQVDKQMRLLTQYFYHCSGMSVWDARMRRPRLILRNWHLFDASMFWRWQSSKARTSYLRTRFAYAIETHTWFLTQSDRLLFDCFDSFQRLDRIGKFARWAAFEHCRLPNDYYFNLHGKNGFFWHPSLDPLGKGYRENLPALHKPKNLPSFAYREIAPGIEILDPPSPFSDHSSGCVGVPPSARGEELPRTRKSRAVPSDRAHVE